MVEESTTVLQSAILDKIADFCGIDAPLHETEVIPMLQAALKTDVFLAVVRSNKWEKITDERTCKFLKMCYTLQQKGRPILVPPDIKFVESGDTSSKAPDTEDDDSTENVEELLDQIKHNTIKQEDVVDEEIDHHPTNDEASAAELLDLWEKTSIHIPYFQREFCWNVKAQEKFIVSWMRGVPIPNIILASDPLEADQKVCEVIDGLQRLSSLRAFRDGYIKYRDKYWHQLTDKQKERFNGRQMSIQRIVTPRGYWPEIFRDVNVNGTPCNTMEIRRSVFYKSRFLHELHKINKKHKVWKDLYGNSKRQRGLEQLLRSSAMHLSYKQYEKNMEKFLDNFCAETLTGTYDEFDLPKHINNVLNAFVYLEGQKAFKIGARRNVNKSLVDCLFHAGLMISRMNLSTVTSENLGILIGAIRVELEKDAKFCFVCISNSNTYESIRFRLEQTEHVVEEILSGLAGID